MMVSCSWIFVNRLPPQVSLAPEGREKLWLRRRVEGPAAYKAPGAAISGVLATWTSPENEVLEVSTVTVVLQAAARVLVESAPKYTSSGVA